MENDPVALYDLMLENVSGEALKTLCFRLRVNYDDLSGDGRAGKARELVNLMERNDRLEDLSAELDKFLTPAEHIDFVEDKDTKNKLLLLKKVEDFWITGVLEQSIHSMVLIELGKEENLEAVERPWDLVLDTQGEMNRSVPKGTKIGEIFENAGRSLLILGEPGAGKTVTLLELAQDKIADAKQNPNQSIPVVFNLSSWAEKRVKLSEWLIDELNGKYLIPRRISRPWVENNDLLLLLDGLDEVDPRYREDCVEAINAFRLEYGLTEIVICSRIADYEEIGIKLALQGAIRLQPLSDEQVQEYFNAAGPQLAVVQMALEKDVALRELTKSPLMLSIMSLAYQDISSEALESSQLTTIEEHRKNLFATYIDRMLKRRGESLKYTRDKTIQKLTWLASKMVQHNQSVFMMEQLQPSWLSSTRERLPYIIGTRIISGLLLGVVLMLLALPPDGWWLLQIIENPAERSFFILTIVLIWLGVGVGLGIFDSVKLLRQGLKTAAEVKPTIWRTLINTLILYLLLVGIFVVVGSLTWLGNYYELKYVVQYALGFSVLPAVILGFRGHWQTIFQDIRTVENFSWNWPGFLTYFLPVSVGLGILVFLITSISYTPGIRLWDVGREEFIASFDAIEGVTSTNEFPGPDRFPRVGGFRGGDKVFIAYGKGNLVWVWNVETRESYTVSTADWLVTGEQQQLLVTVDGGVTRLRDILTGELMVSVPGRFLEVNSTGSLLTTRAEDFTRQLWRVSDGALLGTIEVESEFQFVSPVYTSNEDTVQVWNPTDGTLITSTDGSFEWVDRADTYLVTRNLSGTVNITNIAANNILDASLDDVEGKFFWISSDGSLIETINNLGNRYLWRVEDGMHLGEVLYNFGDEIVIRDDTQRYQVLHADGRLVGSIDGELGSIQGFYQDGTLLVDAVNGVYRLWNVQTSQQMGTILNYPNGQPFFLVEGEDNTIKVWSNDDSSSLAPFAEYEGKYLDTFGYFLITEVDGEAWLWDMSGGGFIGVIDNYSNRSDREPYVLAGDDAFQVIDPRYAILTTIEGRYEGFYNVGSLVVTRDDPGTTHLWYLDNFIHIAAFENLIGDIYAAFYVASGGGSYLVTVDTEGVYRLWSISNEELLGVILNDEFVQTYDPVSNQPGQIITIDENKTISVWDLVTGQTFGPIEMETLEGIPQDAQYAAGILAVADEENVSHLWDISTNQLVASIQDLEGEPSGFFVEGSILATQDKNSGKAWLWKIPEGSLLNFFDLSDGLVINDLYAGGSLMVTVDSDLGIHTLWNTVNGERLGVISSLPFGQELNDLLFVRNVGGYLDVWDSHSGKLSQSLTEFGSSDAIFHKSDNYLVTRDFGTGKIKFWTITETGLAPMPKTIEGNYILDLPQNELIIVGNDDRTWVWNYVDARLIATIEGAYIGSYYTDYQPVMSTADSENNFTVWGMKDEETLFDFRYVSQGTWIMDSQLFRFEMDDEIYLAGDKLLVTYDENSTSLLLKDGQDGRELGRIINKPGVIRDLVEYPFLWVENNGQVIQWSLSDGEQVPGKSEQYAGTFVGNGIIISLNNNFFRTLGKNEQGSVIEDYRFSFPDTEIMVTNNEENQVNVWNLSDFSLVDSFEWSGGNIMVGNGWTSTADQSIFAIRSTEPSDDLRYISFIIILVGLILGLIGGLQSSIREAKTRPNQGTWLSARNSIVIGFFGGAVVGLTIRGMLSVLGRSSFPISPIYLINLDNLAIIRIWIGVGLAIALWFGLMDVLQHVFLRLVLLIRKHTLGRYAAFLDFATERILLRKVGGGYIFIHRHLLEYFASLDGDK